MAANGTTKATGAAAKAARQARVGKLLAATEPTMSDEERAVQAAAGDFDYDSRSEEGPASEPTKQAETPKAKAEKQPKAPKPEKPAVDRLTRVIEAQSAPTMWQYARLAKAVKARMEAGQDSHDALLQVMDQTVEIISGILAENPETSKDSDIDGATKAYFEQTRPKSMQRQRGPRESGEQTTGK